MSHPASSHELASIAPAADLTPGDVETIFRELLGRPATAGDVSFWMQTGSLRAFLDGILVSEEYKQRLAGRDRAEQARAQGPFLNCWVEGWERFTRPLGEISPDGVAIVGERGHLFIYGGSNDNVATHRGEVATPEGWMDSWRQIVSQRVEQARDRGRRVAFVVAPEKLAVYGDLFPQDLTARARRPVLSLLDEAGLPLVYPQDALRHGRSHGETYLRTDSHLTPHGNLLLAAATMRELGITATLPDQVEYAPHSHLAAGDLGQHFDPPVFEVMTPIAGASRATLVSDNWAQIVAIGGHIGTRRVFRRDDAPDQRTAVVFGDSYSFGDDAYQGLSWFLAQICREVHFVWVPFGWDPQYLDRVGAELVVCQTAERFIGRVPQARVDTASMVQETMSARKPLTEESIFRDRPSR